MNTPRSFTLIKEPADLMTRRRELSTSPGAFIKAVRMVLGAPLSTDQKRLLRELYRGGNSWSIGRTLGSSASLDEGSLRPLFGEAWHTVRQLLESKDAVSMVVAAMNEIPRTSRIEVLTAERIEELGLVSMRGHFEERIVYVHHPAKPTYYIPMGSFHTVIKQDKWHQFIRLAGSLGARTVQIKEGSDHHKEASLHAGVSIKDTPLGMNVKAHSHHARAQHMLTSISFEQEPLHSPWVPDDIDWLEQEPMWQSMVRHRMELRCSHLHVEFSYRDEYGIDADFAAEFKNVLKLELGGSFEQAHAINQEVEVIFWPYPDDISS